MNFIKHIVEPKRLLLAWQAPEGMGNRTRFVVATLERKPDGRIVFTYALESPEFEQAKRLGFQHHQAFKVTSQPYDSDVLATFMRRLPPRSRLDFGQYLEQLRIPVDADISDFALLGYSGAKLPGDGFSIIHPFDEVNAPCELVTEVAGFRYRKGVTAEDLKPGDAVKLLREPDNKADPNAIQVLLRGQLIGYINRGQLPAFHRWRREAKVLVHIERVNGTADRPLVFLFVKVLERAQSRLAA